MQTSQYSIRKEEVIPFTISRHSIVSKTHDYNEDRIIADRDLGIAAVFDGVGSASGDIASKIAVNVTRKFWKQARLQLDRLSTKNRPDLCSLLEDLLNEVNVQIVTKAAGSKTATTAALAVFLPQNTGPKSTYLMTYAHVGDSRIYLLRQNEELRSLTDDDGYLSILLREQRIDQAEADFIDQADRAEQLTDIQRIYFSKRNGITQALGDTRLRTLETHCNQLTLVRGDRILLCSDGIHDNLTNQEIEFTLKEKARSTLAKKLVLQARQRSEEENTHLRAKADDMSAVVFTYN